MAIPNIQTVNLANTLWNSARPTTDVKFTFVHQVSGERLELDAHKLILACGSEVFMTQFFGLIREECDVIPVEDASYDAFKVFLDLLYNKSVPVRQASFKILAELYYLADKYLMEEMKEMIILEVSSRKMISRHLIEAAKVAEENAHMDEFSESIIQLCSIFIKDDLKSVLDIFNIEEAGSDNSLVLHRLLGKISKVIPSLGKEIVEVLDSDKESNKTLLDWIEKHCSTRLTNPSFIRLLTTAVIESVCYGVAQSKLNLKQLRIRNPVLKKFFDGKPKCEMEALLAIQQLMHRLDHPNGLLQSIFESLYDDDVLSAEAFLAWKENEDPTEQEGKQEAIYSSKQFFSWLTYVDEDEDD